MGTRKSNIQLKQVEESFDGIVGHRNIFRNLSPFYGVPNPRRLFMMVLHQRVLICMHQPTTNNNDSNLDQHLSREKIMTRKN